MRLHNVAVELLLLADNILIILTSYESKMFFNVIQFTQLSGRCDINPVSVHNNCIADHAFARKEVCIYSRWK